MGRLDLATGMSDLQRSLRPGDLVRDFGQYCELFEMAGVNLQAIIFDRLMAEGSSTEPFRVVDAGSGSGNAIEQVARMIKTWMFYMRIERPLDAVGIDTNLVTDVAPTILATGSEAGLPQDPIARFVQSDATNLGLDDDSVDVLFSSNTLVYVADSLRALTEGYRVLRPDGVAIWDVPIANISFGLNFPEIIRITPGASEVFRYAHVDKKQGMVRCKKDPGSGFKGFPFRLERELSYVPDDDFEGDVPARVAHFRSAVYKTVPK